MIKADQEKGRCDFCFTDEIYIYNMEKQDFLEPYLNKIIDVYQPTSIITGFSAGQAVLLKGELLQKWNIFNDALSGNEVYDIITGICSKRYREKPEVFNNSVGITAAIDEEYMKENTLFKNTNWEEFEKDIKFRSRFHTDYFNKELFRYYSEYSTKILKTNEIYYRARISNDKGYSKEEMYAPRSGKSSDGRANPRGISYLYLSNSKRTTLHEVRAVIHDYITVGEFRIKSDLKIIDFTLLDKISPFINDDFDETLYIINRENLNRIHKEIIRPLRSGESDLNYLPTQYIVDYIRSLGYEGIKYSSSRDEGSFNLALFSEEKVNCENVKLIKVDKVLYDWPS